MREPRFADVVEQRTEAERRERVTGVERDRHAVLDVHRRASAAGVAAVLDVVVDQERGVEQLDGRGGGQRVVDGPAERLARGEAEGRPEALALPHGERAQRLVEVTSRLAPVDVARDRRRGQGPVRGEPVVDRPGRLFTHRRPRRRRHAHGRSVCSGQPTTTSETSTRTRNETSASSRARTRPWYEPGTVATGTSTVSSTPRLFHAAMGSDGAVDAHLRGRDRRALEAPEAGAAERGRRLLAVRPVVDPERAARGLARSRPEHEQVIVVVGAGGVVAGGRVETAGERQHPVEHVDREVDGPLEVDAEAAQLGLDVAAPDPAGGRQVAVEVEHARGHRL